MYTSPDEAWDIGVGGEILPTKSTSSRDTISLASATRSRHREAARVVGPRAVPLLKGPRLLHAEVVYMTP